MEIKIIALAFMVLILICVVIAVVISNRTLEERCDRLERRNRRIEDNILELSSDVDMLKISDDSRKKSELMVERKQKMVDCLTEHYSDSSIDLVGHLYDIANGIKEDK